MQIPGAMITTLANPKRYTAAQLDRACLIAAALNRGRLVLCEEPQR
jgi:hypothetical protein